MKLSSNTGMCFTMLAVLSDEWAVVYLRKLFMCGCSQQKHACACTFMGLKCTSAWCFSISDFFQALVSWFKVGIYSTFSFSCQGKRARSASHQKAVVAWAYCLHLHKYEAYTPVCPVRRPHQRSHAVLIHHVHILIKRKEIMKTLKELKTKWEMENRSSRAPPDGQLRYRNAPNSMKNPNNTDTRTKEEMII